MRTNSNTFALVYLKRNPYKINEYEDILSGRQVRVFVFLEMGNHLFKSDWLAQ